jgi:hypothetical protein
VGNRNGKRVVDHAQTVLRLNRSSGLTLLPPKAGAAPGALADRNHCRTQSASAKPEVLAHDAVAVSPDFVRAIIPPGHVTDASFSPGSHASSHLSPEHSWLSTCKPSEAA